MKQVECPYCHAMSTDMEFCDECGKNIEQVLLNEAKEKQTFDFRDKWIDGIFDLNCNVVEVNNNVCDTKVLVTQEDDIEYPFYCKLKDGKYNLYFMKDESIQNLRTWIQSKAASLEDVLNIVRRMCLIIQKIQKSNSILGTFDLSDFWIRNDNLNTLFFRVVRPFYKQGELISNMNLGEFTALEIKNNVPNDLDCSSDVFLIGNVLVNLILNKEKYANYSEFRYLAHELNVFKEDIPIGLHKWIGKSTSIINNERYKNVTEQLNQLNKILSSDKRRKCKYNEMNYEIEAFMDTNCGDGKRSKFKSEVPENVINEDRVILLNDNNLNSNKFLGIVADGISTCKYGSGARAAQHVIGAANDLWKEKSKTLNSDDEVRKFFEDIVIESNKRIMDEITKEYGSEIEISEIESFEIMGSTLAGVFMDNNTVYSVSVGDSRTYVYSEKGINIVHYDDNVFNEKIKQKLFWNDIQQIDDKYSITKNIGNISLDVKDIVKMKKFKLFEDEILLICSDGLSDYINPIEYKNDEWNIDKKLGEIINNQRNGKNALNKISNILISEANGNGGGDNISIILVKACSKSQ